MKHRASFVIVFWWLLLLLTVGGWLLLKAEREPVASKTENRMLQGLPQLSGEDVFSGAYMSQFEAFLSDRMPGRDGVISATNTMLDAFSALKAEDYLATDMADALNAEVEAFSEEFGAAEPAEDGAEAAETPAAPAQAAGATAPESGADDAAPASGEEAAGTDRDFGMWLLRADGRRENIYSYKRYQLRQIAFMLNAYTELIGEDGLVMFAHIPNANLVNRWVLGDFVGMSSNAETEIAQYTNERVVVLNATELLTPHIEDGEYLFFRTDHHWTPRAACYLHEAFLEAQGIPALVYEDYTYAKIEGYLGSVYESMPSTYYKELADTIEVMEPLTPTRMHTVRRLRHQTEELLIDLSRSDYKVFVGPAKGPSWRIETGAHTGRNLLVISDSFGNALVPYMTPYYDEVHLINLRKDMYTPGRANATIREYMTHYAIDDVFICPSSLTGIGSRNLQEYLMEYIDDGY